MNQIEHLLLALTGDQIKLLADLLDRGELDLTTPDEELKALQTFFATAKRRLADKEAKNTNSGAWDAWQKEQSKK